MNNTYQELTSFKYEANLLYTESFLSDHHITFESKHDAPFRISVKPEDYSKASTLVKTLDLDESEVDEDSDGYIDGYEEWADKRYVTGYFTGGIIPRWMYSKIYARYFGPLFIAMGLFYLISGFDMIGSALNINVLSPFVISLIYTVCGVLMSIRGFKK